MIKQYTKKCAFLLLFCCAITHSIKAGHFLHDLLIFFVEASLEVEKETKKIERIQHDTAKTTPPRQTHHSTQRQSTYAQKPDKQQLFDSLEKKLRELADIDNQPAIIQEGLWKKKQEVVADTFKQNFATHAQAEKYAFEHLPGGIREFFVTKVVENAQSKITTSQKENDLKKVAEHFGHQIDQKLSNKRSVKELFKNLNTDVDSYIKNYINNQRNTTTPQRPAVIHDYTPTAPRIEEFNRPEPSSLYPNIDDIQVEFVEEILPQGETDIEVFKSKTIEKKIYSATDCGVCLEPFFTELKKRSTLRCGHQICTGCQIGCMEAQIKQNIQPTCPICRHPIDSKDFSIAYLRSKL